MVSQRSSTNLKDVAQLELLPVRAVKTDPIHLQTLLSKPTLHKAITYSVELTNLEPKNICEGLKMDKAVWSRIVNGGMSIPADDLHSLANITLNDAPLLWLIHQHGYDVTKLVRLQDDTQRENAELRAQIDQLQAERKVIAQFLKDAGLVR